MFYFKHKTKDGKEYEFGFDGGIILVIFKGIEFFGKWLG